MAKRKAAKTGLSDNNPEVLFQPIGEPEPSQEPTEADRLKALQDELKELKEQVKAGATREERLQGMFMQLAAGGQRQDGQTVAQPSAIDFSKLPDPAKEPDKYRDALQKQINDAIQSNVTAQVQPVVQANERARKIGELWNNFQNKYEDLADFRDIAEVVAGQVLRDAGVKSPEEADRLMFNDTFLDNVAAKMRARIDAIRGTNEDDEDGEGDEGQPQRTLGVAGAAAAGNPGPRGNTPTAGSNLVSELKEMQKGIYH